MTVGPTPKAEVWAIAIHFDTNPIAATAHVMRSRLRKALLMWGAHVSIAEESEYVSGLVFVKRRDPAGDSFVSHASILIERSNATNLTPI